MIDSNMPSVLELTARDDTSPIKMAYAGEQWDSTMNHCVIDENFDGGFKSMDCGLLVGSLWVRYEKQEVYEEEVRVGLPWISMDLPFENRTEH